jgi:hypothetical protein
LPLLPSSARVGDAWSHELQQQSIPAAISTAGEELEQRKETKLQSAIISGIHVPTIAAIDETECSIFSAKEQGRPF